METVVITIDLESNVEVKVEGVKGPACERLSQAIEQDLGAVTNRERTREYAERVVHNSNKR